MGETLLFSAKMRSPAHIQESHLEKSVDTVLEWMGLTEDHKNTFVGDANLKGISGGQKRRLSIGVEVVSGFSICIAELPTNGLDAKTAFEVVHCAKKVATAGDKSMIMSLAQPSPELFDLFENCCLLAMGECIYFGAQSQVRSYLLNQCKLIQPQNKSLPAWIEELTVKPTKFMSDSLRNDMMLSKVTRTLSQVTDRQVIRYLAKKFRNSKHFADLSKEVLWRHLDLINADSKCTKIPERQSQEEVEEEEKVGDEAPKTPKSPKTSEIQQTQENQQSTENQESAITDTMDSMSNTMTNTLSTNTTGSGTGFGSLASQLHRRTTDKLTSTLEMKGESETSMNSMLESQGDLNLFDNDGNYLNYEKTYDLRGLEWGFLWKLPRLPSPMYQIKEICKRQFLATSRNKALIFSRLLQAFIAAICLGALFFNIGTNDIDISEVSDVWNGLDLSNPEIVANLDNAQKMALKDCGEGMRSRVGVLFFIVGFMGFGAVPFIPALSTQLPVFYYQKQSGYFKVYCFYLAQVIAEVPFTLVESVIFSGIAYPMIGLYASIQCFAAFFWITFLVRLTSWSFCMAVTGAVGNASVAQSIATLVLPIWYAFNGYLVPTKHFPNSVHLKWIAESSFFTYPFQYLVRSELKSVANGSAGGAMGPTTFAANQWLSNYGIKLDELAAVDLIAVIGVTLWWFTLFNAAACVCLYFIDYSVISYKKSVNSMNQRIDAVFGVIADVCCCGLGGEGRQNRKKEYVRKQIEQYQQRKTQDITIQMNMNTTDATRNSKVEDDSSQNPDVYLEFKNITYSVPIKNKVTGKVENRFVLLT